ncbi:MAG: epoxyqueuosine reductase QueH, partial [Candidatus Omnitrophica bacterium]|nr:epoxyqueuosine reductase QueH [Candidatus Omnitrophota bacterium]
LHTCCAPCAIYPSECANNDGYSNITLFYYNPNIHPEDEFYRRKEQIEELLDKGPKLRMDRIYIGYDPKEYFQEVKEYDDPKKRCFQCWQMRIKKTAQFARDNGFDSFTTTLLVSPYQDQEILKQIGEELSKEVGIDFYCRDFMEGFKKAHKKAHEIGLYCQNYCGCIFSIVEREQRKLDRKTRK